MLFESIPQFTRRRNTKLQGLKCSQNPHDPFSFPTSTCPIPKTVYLCQTSRHYPEIAVDAPSKPRLILDKSTSPSTLLTFKRRSRPVPRLTGPFSNAYHTYHRTLTRQSTMPCVRIFYQPYRCPSCDLALSPDPGPDYNWLDSPETRAQRFHPHIPCSTRSFYRTCDCPWDKQGPVAVQSTVVKVENKRLCEGCQSKGRTTGGERRIEGSNRRLWGEQRREGSSVGRDPVRGRGSWDVIGDAGERREEGAEGRRERGERLPGIRELEERGALPTWRVLLERSGGGMPLPWQEFRRVGGNRR
ncbi:hypothetical protein QBC40DRAFT_312550 [Triangularia verruculosa]|uniref:Uncharacterized protein n=1 Tax=Triangularia verruculosa TaxID=2587418 RepID=A0AAN7APZ0_9PEZI|nr:hypothetical protein QBC40DRAFT_312550 [Triangularia verruculosa]